MSTSRRNLLVSGAALAVPTVAVAMPAENDAKLLRLIDEYLAADKEWGRLIKLAITADDDDKVNDQCDRVNDLQRQIAKTPAHTLAGLTGKAHIANGHPNLPDIDGCGPSDILLSIMRDLLRVDGVSA